MIAYIIMEACANQDYHKVGPGSGKVKEKIRLCEKNQPFDRRNEDDHIISTFSLLNWLFYDV